MMYPFITLNDDTEIVHSMHSGGCMKVYIERPDGHDGFHHVTCWLPDDVWEGNFGFSESDLTRFKDIVRSCAHLLLEFVAGRGFENA